MSKILQKWVRCIFFSFTLFFLVYLTEQMASIIHDFSNHEYLTATGLFVLLVFGGIPLFLLLMWHLNPFLIEIIFSQFNLAEKSLDKKPQENKENNKNKLNIEPLTHDQINLAILTATYLKAETHPFGCLTVDNLLKVIPVPISTLEFSLKYLSDKRLIEYFRGHGGIVNITANGIDILTHKEENKNKQLFLTATLPVSVNFSLINIG